MNDGVAIKSTDGIFRDPFDGTITIILHTKHAFSMTSYTGVKPLVHIGVDTVDLVDQGFKVLAEAETYVTKGTTIIEADLNFIAEKSY